MSRRFSGSLDLTALGEAARANHPSIKKGNNGHTYSNVTIWQNDEPDQWGNTISIQLQQPMDSDLAKVYVGRAKPPQPKADTAPTPQGDEANDLPF